MVISVMNCQDIYSLLPLRIEQHSPSFRPRSKPKSELQLGRMNNTPLPPFLLVFALSQISRVRVHPAENAQNPTETLATRPKISAGLFHNDWKRVIRVIKRFSIECLKTKTKVITLVNHSRCKQRNEPIRIQSKYM